MTDFDWDAVPLRMRAELDASIGIRDLVLQRIKAEHEAIEEMTERMLTSPEGCGIAVVLNEIIDLDNLEGSLTRQYRLDPHVPFGHIYEFSSMRSYEAWQERGYPT